MYLSLFITFLAKPKDEKFDIFLGLKIQNPLLKNKLHGNTKKL